jgi:predicted nucleotidyltransferase
MDERQRFDALVEALRIAVPALRAAQVPFLLGGSMAVWAHGGPPPVNDLDLMVREADAERTLEALARAGMRTEHPPEEWLVKAWNGEVLVDVIHNPRGLPITDEVLARGRELHVCALRVPVMALEDVLTTKLLALDEHRLDYAGLLQIARAVREQVDWELLRARTQDWPYAAAFLTLVERLEVAPAPASSGRPVEQPATLPLGRRAGG